MMSSCFPNMVLVIRDLKSSYIIKVAKNLHDLAENIFNYSIKRHHSLCHLFEEGELKCKVPELNQLIKVFDSRNDH